jgi:O-antigen ligase
MNRLSRYSDGLVESAWLLAVIFVPLYYSLNIAQILGTGKTAMFRSACLIGLAGWLTKAILNAGKASSQTNPWKRFASQPLAIPVALLAAVYIISTVFSINPISSFYGSYARFEGLLTLLSYLLIFAMVAVNLRRREQADRVIMALAAVNFAVDLYAIIQHLGLDPILWSTPVTIRANSVIGHPIFMAAFLGMSLMVMVGRLVYLIHQVRRNPERSENLALAALYALVCFLNLLAIWYANARGPLLALIFASLFLGFILLAYWQLRRTFYTFAAAGIALLVFLSVLNIPNGPLSGLRDNPYLGPLGHAFDSETGTGRARVLIWNGVVRLVTPHDPLRLPEGGGDRWNFLRPLVGYGPETLHLVYEDYYSPETFSLEGYELFHDRAHNEFWELLASYGLFGLVVEYGTYLLLLYHGLKWLGWIPSNKESRLYWVLSAAGGIVGGVAAFFAFGVEFLGIGIPLGLLLGALWMVSLRMFRGGAGTEAPPDVWRDMILIGGMGLVVFHYVEILLGIAIITSRVPFWSVCGVMLVAGGNLWTEIEKAAPRSAIQQAGIQAGMLVAIIVALLPTFISTNQLGLDASPLFTTMLVANFSSILWMFLGIFAFTSILFELEAAVSFGRKVLIPNLVLMLGVAFFTFFAIWVSCANQLNAIMQSYDFPSAVVDNYLTLLAVEFGTLVVLAYVWAAALPDFSGARKSRLELPILAIFGSIQILALVLSFFVNLRPFQANGIAKMLNLYVGQQQYQSAFTVGEKLIALDPRQDAYLLAVADVNADYANLNINRQNVTGYLLKAEGYYKQAYKLNPLFYRNRMGMAKINRVWARSLTDPASRKTYISQAEKFYADFLESRPYRVRLWVEWADFRVEFGDAQGARQKVDTAIKVDPTYPLAYLLSSQLYLKEADKQTDPAKRAELWKLALTDLQMQIQTTRSEDNPAFAWLDIGDVYVLLQQYGQAREAYLQAQRLGLGDYQWESYKKLAEVAGKTNDTTAQRIYLQQAISLAPIEEIAGLQKVLDSLRP